MVRPTPLHGKYIIILKIRKLLLAYHPRAPGFSKTIHGYKVQGIVVILQPLDLFQILFYIIEMWQF